MHDVDPQVAPGQLGRIALGQHLDRLAVDRDRVIARLDGAGEGALTSFVWTADSRWLIAHAYERTRSRLYRLPLRGGKPVAIAVGDWVLDTDLHADARGRYLGFAATKSQTPQTVLALDLRLARPGRSGIRRLTDINPQVSSWSLGKADVVRWKSRDGTEIEGILTVTPHAEPGGCTTARGHAPRRARTG